MSLENAKHFEWTGLRGVAPHQANQPNNNKTNSYSPCAQAQQLPEIVSFKAVSGGKHLRSSSFHVLMSLILLTHITCLPVYPRAQSLLHCPRFSHVNGVMTNHDLQQSDQALNLPFILLRRSTYL